MQVLKTTVLTVWDRNLQLAFYSMLIYGPWASWWKAASWQRHGSAARPPWTGPPGARSLCALWRSAKAAQIATRGCGAAVSALPQLERFCTLNQVDHLRQPYQPLPRLVAGHRRRRRARCGRRYPRGSRHQVRRRAREEPPGRGKVPSLAAAHAATSPLQRHTRLLGAALWRELPLESSLLAAWMPKERLLYGLRSGA